MSFHNEHTPGEMIERIDGDANQLGGFFSTFVIQILGNAVLLVGILALLFREDWRAGLALTLFAAFTVIVIYRIRTLRCPTGEQAARRARTPSASRRSGCQGPRISARARRSPTSCAGSTSTCADGFAGRCGRRS